MKVIVITPAFIEDWPNWEEQPPTIAEMQAKLAALGCGVERWIADAPGDVGAGFVIVHNQHGTRESARWLWDQFYGQGKGIPYGTFPGEMQTAKRLKASNDRHARRTIRTILSEKKRDLRSAIAALASVFNEKELLRNKAEALRAREATFRLAATDEKTLAAAMEPMLLPGEERRIIRWALTVLFSMAHHDAAPQMREQLHQWSNAHLEEDDDAHLPGVLLRLAVMLTADREAAQ
jgi:hypothetical protein